MKRYKSSEGDCYEQFIVLEGIDGAGTTTQRDLLVQALKSAGESVHSTCEPTEGNIGRLIRAILDSDDMLEPRSMAMLFAADRFEHACSSRYGFLKHLNAGTWVVCDRYVFSSLAYQGPEVGFGEVKLLNSGIPLPHWVFHLQIDSSVAMSRLETREKLDLYENHEFQSAVARAYSESLNQYRTENSQWIEIDASLSVAEIHRIICNHLGILPIHVE